MIASILRYGLAIAMATAAITPAWAAAPFGLKMGDKNLDFGDRWDRPNWFWLNSVPMPDPRFNRYAVLFGSSGLCRILVGTPYFPDDRTGRDARTAFDQIKSEIDGLYGNGRYWNKIVNGSPWSADSDFVMSIAREQREYIAVWSSELGSKMRDDLVYIELKIVGHDGYKAILTVSYEFKNIDICADEAAAARRAASKD